MFALRQFAAGKRRVAQATLLFFRFAFSLAYLIVALFPVVAARAQQKTPAKKPASNQTATDTSAKKASTKTAPKKSKKARTASARNRAQKAPTPDRILEIQTALARSGHFAGEPTGKWDAVSISATKNYQQAQGLKVTGKIDAASLQKLGLGSQTAGVAAPRPTGSTAEGATRNR